MNGNNKCDQTEGIDQLEREHSNRCFLSNQTSKHEKWKVFFLHLHKTFVWLKHSLSVSFFFTTNITGTCRKMHLISKNSHNKHDHWPKNVCTKHLFMDHRIRQFCSGSAADLYFSDLGWASLARAVSHFHSLPKECWEKEKPSWLIN